MLNFCRLFWMGSLRPALVDYINLGKLRAKWLLKSWFFQSFNGLLVISSFIFIFTAVRSAYFYVFPTYQPVIVNLGNAALSDISIVPWDNEAIAYTDTECNVFDGRWVPDESYPLYDGSQCPFTERGFNCLANGSRNQEYLRWRWQPMDCDIPRFDVNVVLEWLRGKRVVFAGDSLGRNQWESMVCMLMTGIEDPTIVYEINGRRITRVIPHLAVRFSSFNFTVEFYRSTFLVRISQRPKRAPEWVKSVLQLDMMDDISEEYVHSDVLIFNTGHWWKNTKLFDSGLYFQVGERLELGMSIPDALNKALSTWKSWVESSINTGRTHVFFRTYESDHWGTGYCEVTRRPMSRAEGLDRHPYSDAILEVTKNLSVPVTVLHVTPMTAFRSDAHVGNWGDNPSIRDCSHWCLPGVPDMWNEFIFSSLFSRIKS